MHITIEFIMLVIAGFTLLLTVIGNVVAIAYLAGKLSANQKTLSDVVKELKENFNNKINDLKENFNGKIDDLKENFAEKSAASNRNIEEHIRRLEEKQDKHNGLYDKVVENTQSCKSAHHRLDEIKESMNENFAKRN